MNDSEMDVRVRVDMESQQRWHLLMDPMASMLKFRLPWEPGETEYLAGQVRLPVWGPTTTTESRLWVTGTDKRSWDNTKYEQQMMHFNTETRMSLYEHPVPSGHVSVRGLCHCYDCTSEVDILCRYMRKFQSQRIRNFSAREWNREIEAWIPYISSMCSYTRNLWDPNPDPSTRNAVIRKNQGSFKENSRRSDARKKPTLANDQRLRYIWGGKGRDKQQSAVGYSHGRSGQFQCDFCGSGE
jgi:cap2 methyltransferase